MDSVRTQRGQFLIPGISRRCVILDTIVPFSYLKMRRWDVGIVVLGNIKMPKEAVNSVKMGTFNQKIITTQLQQNKY